MRDAGRDHIRLVRQHPLVRFDTHLPIIPEGSAVRSAICIFVSFPVAGGQGSCQCGVGSPMPQLQMGGMYRPVSVIEENGRSRHGAFVGRVFPRNDMQDSRGKAAPPAHGIQLTSIEAEFRTLKSRLGEHRPRRAAALKSIAYSADLVAGAE
jgi:hypothetical protein